MQKLFNAFDVLHIRDRLDLHKILQLGFSILGGWKETLKIASFMLGLEKRQITGYSPCSYCFCSGQFTLLDKTVLSFKYSYL